MSKQDTHFFNVFSLVIGLLVAVAVGLFALARTIADLDAAASISAAHLGEAVMLRCLDRDGGATAPSAPGDRPPV